MPASSTEICAIVDRHLASGDFTSTHKADRSLVTDLDVAIQRDVTALLRSRHPTLRVIGEEDEGGHHERYDLRGDYLVIDPIDGTENFVAGSPLFGCMVSARASGDELHLIYLPRLGLTVCSDALPDATLHPHTDVTLLSTKCMFQPHERVDSLRVIGSSAVMFAMLLTGQAATYRYCVGAKIWDCYTGLQLAHRMGLDIHLTGHELQAWLERPSHRTEFEIRWKR